MTTSDRRLTARGAATRARIVEAAAELMYTRGVAATTLDDVRAVSGVSKSQLYSHFPDKSALVQAVVSHQGAAVLEVSSRGLSRLSSLRGLERWCDDVVHQVALRHGADGCRVGSLASELADVNEDARVLLADTFGTWERLFADGFRRMPGLHADADVLATAMVTALQGGYLLSQTTRDAAPMRVALDMALSYVRASTGPAAAE